MNNLLKKSKSKVALDALLEMYADPARATDPTYHADPDYDKFWGAMSTEPEVIKTGEAPLPSQKHDPVDPDLNPEDKIFKRSEDPGQRDTSIDLPELISNAGGKSYLFDHFRSAEEVANYLQEVQDNLISSLLEEYGEIKEVDPQAITDWAYEFFPKVASKMAADLNILGTVASGFAGGGPFSCMNCVHRTPHSKNAEGEEVDSCKHPKVMADPELQHRKLPDGTIEVDNDDCCTFVRPKPEEKKEDVPTPERPKVSRSRLEKLQARTDPEGLKTSADASVLAELQKKYPKVVALSKHQDEHYYGNWHDVTRSCNPVLELEKLVVYETLSRLGPDVSYELLGRVVRSIRKACNGDILQAYESKTLADILDDSGFFGPKSDVLRGPSDHFYSSLRRRRDYKAGAVEQHETPKFLPQRDDMRGHLDEDVKKEINDMIDKPKQEGVHISSDGEARSEAHEAFLQDASIQQQAKERNCTLDELWGEIGNAYTSEYESRRASDEAEDLNGVTCPNCKSANVLPIVELGVKTASTASLAECVNCSAFFTI